MAGAPIIYYRNYDSSDMTKTPSGRYTSNDPLPTIEACGWEPLSGYQFKEWNVNQDGSGLSFQPGDTISGGSPGFENDKYAIWEPIPVPYLVTSTDLTSIADAIRTKGGTAASLTYPTGFVSAINAIPTGGGSVTSDDVTVDVFNSDLYAPLPEDFIDIIQGQLVGSYNWDGVSDVTLTQFIGAFGATILSYFNG